jgi:hypothetical protein
VILEGGKLVELLEISFTIADGNPDHGNGLAHRQGPCAVGFSEISIYQISEAKRGIPVARCWDKAREV